MGFDPPRLDAARLRTGVEQTLLAEALRERARHFQGLLRDVDGPGAAADAVEDLIREHPRLRPATRRPS